MQEPRNASPQAAQVDLIIDEDRIYAKIAEELETKATDKGLWTRLFAESGGDEKQTKVLYIKQRAERLIAVEHARLDQTAKERAAETIRHQELRLQSLEREKELPADAATPQVAATNICSESKVQSESQRNDEVAGWVLVAVVVGIALLTAALMQVR